MVVVVVVVVVVEVEEEAEADPGELLPARRQRKHVFARRTK